MVNEKLKTKILLLARKVELLNERDLRKGRHKKVANKLRSLVEVNVPKKEKFSIHYGDRVSYQGNEFRYVGYFKGHYLLGTKSLHPVIEVPAKEKDNIIKIEEGDKK